MNRRSLGGALVGFILCAQALSVAPVHTTQPGPGTDCRSNPLGNRDLYLRGTFNSWGAVDSQKFTWICSRFELVTSLRGSHLFKLGDEEWSADADFGGASPEGSVEATDAAQLMPKGAGLRGRFHGVHRFVVTMPKNRVHSAPMLTMTDCPKPAPRGDATLFLRGSMNNWGALDTYAFQYSCDAYYLNVKLSGLQSFKIADATWTLPGTFGASAGGRSTPAYEHAMTIVRGTDAGGANDLSFIFDGEQTIKLEFVGNDPQITIGGRSFADPTAKAVIDPVATSLRHDSRDLANKAPFGAVTAGTKVQFGLSAAAGVSAVTLVIEKRRLEGNQEVLEYAPFARVAMTRRPVVDEHEHWGASHLFGETAIYGYWFEVAVGDKSFVYQNNSDVIYWTREKGSNGAGVITDKPGQTKAIRRFRLTVYEPDFQVPDWAQDAVYYYIFPERFRNGDRNNDPKPGVTRYQNKDIEFHANWLDKPYRPGTGDGSDSVYNNDFFGGDIAGIIEKLDYIAELGANVIYMTPVFRAASNHKYDTADYKTIDPAFGSNDDFTRLTTEAAKRGIRVIPDASLNHTGSDSIYFDRFGNYKRSGAFEGGRIRADSPYAGWYIFDKAQSEPDKQYRGWVGVLDLPELDKSSPAYRKFAYGDPDSVTRTWLNRGASGWRMDVAPWVPDSFWREWRTAVKQTRPDALTIAETWFDSSKFFLGDTFDSTMNYIFRNTVLDYANGGKAKALYANIELMREAYPPQAFYALMNLVSSHDQARATHIFGWQDGKSDEAAITLAKQRLRLATFFQMTFPGSPSIYYADEVGVTGGDDPFNRGTYPWADLGGKPDTALLADFKRLIKMRRDHAVLRRGSIDAPIYVDDNVIVLARRLNDTWAITATNNAGDARDVTITLPKEAAAARFCDVLTGETTTAVGGKLSLNVPPRFGTALVSQ